MKGCTPALNITPDTAAVKDKFLLCVNHGKLHRVAFIFLFHDFFITPFGLAPSWILND